MKAALNSVWFDPRTERKIIIVKRQSDNYLVSPITDGKVGKVTHHIRPWILKKFYKPIA